MAVRQAISKKIRFEVFKRDSFMCQYCGRKAPEILLQIDHIDPVATGGGNAILNLLTSCEECNAGKSDRKLSDHSFLDKQRTQLQLLQERKEQIEMMFEWQKGLVDLDEDVTERLAKFWSQQVPGFSLNENGLKGLKRLRRRFETSEIMEAIRIASESYVQLHKGKPTQESVESAWKKVGGICSNRRREKENPSLARLHYIRGILRNRLSYCNEHMALQLLRQASDYGATLESLEEHAKEVRNWTQWQAGIQDFIVKNEPKDQNENEG